MQLVLFYRNLKKVFIIISFFLYCNLDAQTVTTFAGSATIGNLDGTGIDAQFYYPKGVAADLAGNVFVADNENRLIRKISPQGEVTTFAGSGQYGYADGQGTAAQFAFPQRIAIDASGNLFVTDAHRIRKITAAGTVTTFAGQVDLGYEDGTGTAAKFHNPIGIAVSADGILFVADYLNDRIRKITPAGVVTTFAGSTQGFADGTGSDAKFDRLTGIAVSAEGVVYVTDGQNNRIRKVTVEGIVTTFAGSTVGFADGNGTDAQFTYPFDLALDAAENVYVADAYNNRIRKITMAGNVTTLAGSTYGFADGIGTAAQFREPVSLTLDPAGDMFVADTGNNVIRKITNVLATTSYQLEDYIMVYPNPATSMLNINMDVSRAELIIFDLNGRSLLFKNINENTTVLNISNLSNGLYILQIISESGTFSKKIVKQ